MLSMIHVPLRAFQTVQSSRIENTPRHVSRLWDTLIGALIFVVASAPGSLSAPTNLRIRSGA